MNAPRLLSDAVDKVARQSAGKDWGLYANLLQHWTEIVGPEYAKETTPVKISFPYQPGEAHRKNGVLTIRLPKGLAMEFSFKSEIIRSRLNAYFGYDAFARIVLDSAIIRPPSPQRETPVDPAILNDIKGQASAIENDELRKALEGFGAAVTAENNRKT